MNRQKKFLGRLTTGYMAGSVGTISILMPYHAFFSTWLGTYIGPLLLWKSWKEALLLSAVMAAIAYSLTHWPVARQLFKTPLTLLVLAFTALHILLALLFARSLEPTLAGLLANLRFFAIFLIGQLVVLAVPGLAQRLRQMLTVALLVSSAVVSVLAILQVTVLPATFLEQFGYNKDTTIAPFILLDEQQGALRAFATLRGPNALGQFLLLPLVLLFVVVWRRTVARKWSVPALGLIVVALLLTGSRSAWLGTVAAVIIASCVLANRAQLGRLMRRYGIVAMAIVVAGTFLALEYAPLRLALFHSSPGDSSLTEGSTDLHAQATAAGLADALAHPLGRGPGQAGPASFYATQPRIAENYYVQLAQEVGWLGLALFLAILVIVARQLWRLAKQPNAPPLTVALLASFWGIAVINLFLHGWADDPSALVWWGLAGLVLQGVKASR